MTKISYEFELEKVACIQFKGQLLNIGKVEEYFDNNGKVRCTIKFEDFFDDNPELKMLRKSIQENPFSIRLVGTPKGLNNIKIVDQPRIIT